MTRSRDSITREEAERRPELLAALVPDTPAWLPLRGLLLSGRCRVFTEPAPEHGFIVRSTDYALAATAFSPGLGLLQWTLAMRGAANARPSTGPMELLVPRLSAPWWRKRLPRWRELEVCLLSLDAVAETTEGAAGATVVWWGGTAGHSPADEELPEEVRRELRHTLGRGREMAVVMADGRPASFCHAPFETESLWDVAIYTVRNQRRRGWARIAFEAMARRQRAAGRGPVWSAYVGNDASLALAQKLGFELVPGGLSAFRKPH